MRADRLLQILLLLQNRGKQTAKELATELEVTERTILRDLEALGQAGIPVVAERGKHGGWRLMDDYRTNLTGLKEEEIHALFISPSSHLLADLGMEKGAELARHKLLASLPRLYQKQAKDVWERLHVDTRTWRQSGEKVGGEVFQALQQAVWMERRVKMTYERADGEMVERIVEPLGLVAKGSTWYVVASRRRETEAVGDQAEKSNEYRTYRVTRIKSIIMTEDTFLRPVGFQLAAYWENSTRQFLEHLPTYEAKVEVSPSAVPRMTFTGRFVQMIHKDEPCMDGWTPMTLCFETREEAAGYLLGFADQVRAIQPQELREQIVEMARAVLMMDDDEPHKE
ncbi:helix-turn-helix transcriptional regulator [Brevibacillus dissolubilis]|uniref:helix-turn-helix transcriptional regulator n=1 Tax=Brevibacillus dissolubilis TaxID=1844116 RepID=UPI00111611A2|nr:YafY family protein [Brevibacillus dissolubilis]